MFNVGMISYRMNINKYCGRPRTKLKRSRNHDERLDGRMGQIIIETKGTSTLNDERSWTKIFPVEIDGQRV